MRRAATIATTKGAAMTKNLTGIIIDTDDDTICPLCGSGQIDYVSTDYDYGALYYTNRCSSCGSQFTFSYWIANAIIDRDELNKED